MAKLKYLKFWPVVIPLVTACELLLDITLSHSAGPPGFGHNPTPSQGHPAGRPSKDIPGEQPESPRLALVLQVVNPSVPLA